MPAHRMTFKLVGCDEDNGVVQFDDFREFCRSLSRCLRKSEAIVSGESGQIRYRVAELGTGSATITLEAAPPKKGRDRRSEVLELFQDTVGKLETGGRPDLRVDFEALETFRELVTPLRRRTKEVWVGRERLTTQFQANIEKLLNTSIPSEGSVSGFLELVNVHQRYQFVLYPPVPGYRITCTFPESMLGQVREAIKRNVTVWGKLDFEPENPFPHRVAVTRMELHPPDSELPTLAELKGMAPGCAGGLTSVDFVRALRDEQAR